MSKKMVSKSSILGKSSLIFVTVGTTLFPFVRLFQNLDEVLVESNTESKLIVQGNIDYEWKYKNVELYTELSPSEIQKILQKADKIITHGGFGTMHAIAQHTSFMPLIIARKVEYKEHVDNHQLQFLDFYKNQIPSSYSKYFVTNEDLKELIKIYLREKSQKNMLKSYIFNSSDIQNLEKKLKKYIS